MRLTKFKEIRKKYGYHASFAVWQDAANKSKSNMEDLSIFEKKKVIELLNPEIVLVGLNFSIDIQLKPLENFHGQNGEVYKLRYALKDTILWGAYMTDLIKDFVQKDSSKVMNYLEKNPKYLNKQLQVFEREIKDIGAKKPLIVALGGDVYKLLKKNFKDKYKILKLGHYAAYASYGSKEKYREHVIKKLESTNLVYQLTTSSISRSKLKLTTLQIGKLGELEVQKRFLELGYDSSHLTTDTGVDLVVLIKNKFLSFQVKTILVAAKAGGKGSLAIDWYVPTKNTANYLAFVYYEKKQVWIFNLKDLEKFYKKGQCQKANGKYHLSMYLEENKKSKKIKFRKFYDKYLFENKIKELEK